MSLPGCFPLKQMHMVVGCCESKWNGVELAKIRRLVLPDTPSQSQKRQHHQGTRSREISSGRSRGRNRGIKRNLSHPGKEHTWKRTHMQCLCFKKNTIYKIIFIIYLLIYLFKSYVFIYISAYSIIYPFVYLFNYLLIYLFVSVYIYIYM